MVDKCICCLKNVKLIFKKERYLIYRCPNCGLGFTKNFKSQQGNYHRDEVYIKQHRQFLNIFKKRTEIIKSLIIHPGKVLEIGSSAGLMLSVLKEDGWETLGVEMSKKAAEFAKERGIPTLVTSFEQVDLPKSFFDVVILNHTLEHLKNPEEVVKKIYTLLKKDGLIFINVPNFGGISAKIWGNNWQYLLPEEHIWHFTLNSLVFLLSRNNFSIIYSERNSGIWDYNNPYLEIWQALTGFKKRFFIDLFTALPALIISKLNQGSGLIIVAKKV